jgi:LmbE family N-acetylglucosaminyl deacetylase
MSCRKAVFIAWPLVILAVSVHEPPGAQVRPAYDTGTAALTQILQRLQTTASVLHTGAHPDDEDSAFLARAARGDHARVAYLSLNRGEGGQNLIGAELFDALGVIRTEELLQARRLDGGEQFFTRTVDYGFSKTREEAAAKWNELEALGDMVRVIRTFRPLVIYSRFTGTPADGHGHHQFAGYLTPRAFRAAADPSQFPEQLEEGLRPWQARKLYVRPEPGMSPTLEVQTGALDHVLGRSYAEIAAEGRSQHKSQGMGTLELKGPFSTGLRLTENLVPRAGSTEQSIFDGIDVGIPGLVNLVGLPDDDTLRVHLQTIDRAARQALDEYHPLQPGGIIPVLAEGLRAVRAARLSLLDIAAPAGAKDEAHFLLTLKEREFGDALMYSAGVVLDPLSDEEAVVPGASFGVTTRVFLPPGAGVNVTAVTLKAPAGWSVVEQAAEEVTLGAPQVRRERPSYSVGHRVALPASAPPTQPYFLTEPRQGDSYRWVDGLPKSVPFAPSLLTAAVTLTFDGVPLTVDAPVRYRFADAVRGELRREVNVVPAVTLGLDSQLLIVPLGNLPHQQRLLLRAHSHSSRPVVGTLALRLPQGWTATPREWPLTLENKGDQMSATFTVTIPANRTTGTFEIAARAVVGETTYSNDMQVVGYPHIQTHRIYRPAVVRAQVLDLQIAPLRVGYIMGSGDEVPDALRRMGVDVVLVDSEMLSTGDLSEFDTIVVGIRASEARPDFVANHGRLVQFVERGGTLVVQYQQQEYLARGLAPYPAAGANSRVTDENAPVTILEPDHPAFTFPNRIVASDFTGWVQERNLYAFTEFDARYTPLLESMDPGESPQRGGELYAELGRGRFVYTAYSWFRQLPAGVPGAYRQFANLVSLSKAPSRR